MPPYRMNEPSVAPFVVIPVLLAMALTWAAFIAWRRAGASESSARRATVTTGAATAAWMALTWFAAASGVLGKWEATPPPFALLVLGVIVVSVTLSFGPLGTRIAQEIPLWLLIAVQGFRVPLEIAMHALVARGIMPVQMSYSGRNLDIVSGATGLIVAVLLRAGIGGRWLAGVWNALGLALLINVVTVAIVSTPRIRYFGDDRVVTFVTYVPFVWLPAVMVLAALAGHLVIFRALARWQRV